MEIKKERIHYFMPHGIGDIIMTLPVIREISRNLDADFLITIKSKTEAAIISQLCPELKIDFIYFKEIFANNLLLFATIKLIRRINEYSPDFSLTQFGVDSAKSSIISFLSGSKYRVGWAGPFSFLNQLTLTPSGDHKIIENLKVLNILNIVPGREAEEYPLYRGDNDSLRKVALKFNLSAGSIKIAIGPGSQELDKHKRWPAKNYENLIKRIISEYDNAVILIIGTKEEIELCKEIERDLPPSNRVVNLAGKTHISELLPLLAMVDLTITNCNGVSHLACSADSKIIGLYGPTNYKITGPKSDRFFPISANLDCSPCFSKDYATGCGNPICMDRIEVETVFLKIKDIL